jgi:hypothetical protein
MPEKTTETTTNGATRTADKPMERVEETTRRYMREAETTARDTMRTYNELMRTTTTYTFDTLDKTMRAGMELTKYMTDAWENIFTIYRRMYTDTYKTWETYWDEANKIMSRPR